MKFVKLILILALFSSPAFSNNNSDSSGAGIDEQLGKKIPLETKFYDEAGNQVKLKELFTSPTVLAFVYYRCPGICTPLMSSIADVVSKSDLEPGEDYNIITISMDEYETPAIASDKKKDFMQLISRDFPESSWKFLTGDSVAIKKVTDAAGFHFQRKGENFIHTGALIFLTKEGKITRYLFPGYTAKRGFSILPFDFKMAINETAKGNLTPTIANVLQYCFSYDPEGKTYVLNITRIMGAAVLLLVAVFVVVFIVKPKKKSKER